MLWYVIEIYIARSFYCVGQSNITKASIYTLKPFFHQYLNHFLLLLSEFILRSMWENRNFI